MQPINQLVEKNLTEIKAPLTKDSKTSTTCPEFIRTKLGFETFGDPQLTELGAAVADLLLEMKRGAPPRWLTMLGRSGTGKTHLSRGIWKYAPALLNRPDRFFVADVAFWQWPRVVDDYLREGDYSIISTLIEKDFLALDDIGAEKTTEFVLEKLCRLLDGRLNRWTVLTANFTMKDFAALDLRIASRMIRGSNVCIHIPNTTKDYAHRTR